MTETEIGDGTGMSAAWTRWLATNRMRGSADGQLVQILTENGVTEAAAWTEIARANSDPYFQAGSWVAERLHKLESLLAIQEELRRMAPSSAEIDRRANIATDEFLAQYYAANRPVVISDFADGWRANGWTADSLRAAIGDEPVEVMSGRTADNRYEINGQQHRRTVPFSDYADSVSAAEVSNDFYLVANNHLLDTPPGLPLWDDFDSARPPLDGESARGRAFLWFGPAGTITPLHHDEMNVLFVQLHGRKQFTLVAPGVTPRVYNEVGVYAEVDPANPDYQAYPDFRDAATTLVTLEPGETLFLPVGWWHRVESLDISISLSFTNFMYANQFRWQHPG